MTPEELKLAKKLCKKATLGPWSLDVCWSERHTPNLWRAECPITKTKAQSEINAQFIAAARTLLPKAIEALEKERRESSLIEEQAASRWYLLQEANKENDRLRAALEWYANPDMWDKICDEDGVHYGSRFGPERAREALENK